MSMRLPYIPSQITCSESHLMLSEWDPVKLHIHTWAGDEIAKINAEQLQLGSDDRICCVSPWYDNVVMFGVWCQKKDTDRVVAYKVSKTFKFCIFISWFSLKIC